MQKSKSLIAEKKLYKRNVIVNLLGQCAPLAAAFFAIPMLIKGLGTDRFGILTLAWVVVGYFSLFDMGIGRALTKLTADNLGKGLIKEIPSLIWTALALMGALGTIGSALLAFFTPWLLEHLLNIPHHLQRETLISLYLLAGSIPLVIITTGLRGILEAYQRFDLVNLIRIPMGFFTYLGPLIILPLSKSLVSLVFVLITGRVISCTAHLFLCFRIVPDLIQDVQTKKTLVIQLVSFGGWLTVSSIVGPLMLYLDRFFIASMISASAVAYYTTPYEIIIKFLIIPAAIMGVMFPAFTNAFTDNIYHVSSLYFQTIKYMLLIMFPLVLLTFFYAEQGLGLWINTDFAHNSYRVAQVLVFGVFINSFGHISQSLIQASGRPDITSKLHLVELPFYLIYLIYFLSSYGIEGAALAWLIRVSLSTSALFYLAHRSLINNSSPKENF